MKTFLISIMGSVVCFVLLFSKGFSQEIICNVALFATQSASSSHARGPLSATSYQNIQVNVDPTNHRQVEVSTEVSVVNPNRLVAAWIDYRMIDPRIGYGYSTDGGLTWTDAGLITNITGNPYQGDPAIATDKNGNFYLTFISFNPGFYPCRLWFAKSTDHGVTWPTSLMKRLDYLEDNIFDDKPWIAVDKTNNSLTANNIYIAWMHNTGVNSLVYLRRSTNGGNSFEDTVRVSDIKRRNQVDAMPSVAQMEMFMLRGHRVTVTPYNIFTSINQQMVVLHLDLIIQSEKLR